MRFKNTGTTKDYNNDQLIEHYKFPKFPDQTKILENTTIDEYIWKAGDRFSGVAFKYYGDVRLWWVIAWFNKTPMEYMLEPGDVIVVPRNVDYIVGQF